jgi:carbon monoxide dehydrogenase subunit G
MLHGREAVVPLPNGRAIPVEMTGGGMNTNNTNITVNIDETGATGTVDSEGGAELGIAIQGVVQAELERQMRPGGILGS